MGRFSPSVVRKGISPLAEALNAGQAGYFAQQKRQRDEEDRLLDNKVRGEAHESGMRRDMISDVFRGFRPEKANPTADIAQKLSRDPGSPSADMAAPPVSPDPRIPQLPPVNRTGVPGAFNLETGDFDRVIDLPGMGSVDTGFPARQKGEETLATGRAQNTTAAEGRAALTAELEPMLPAGAPKGAARDRGAFSSWVDQPLDASTDWQFVGENYGSGARWVNRRTQEVRPVTGSSPMPRPQSGLGTASIGVGAQNELAKLIYYRNRTDDAIKLISQDAVGLQNILGVKVMDRVNAGDPQAIQFRTVMMEVANQIRNGLFGAALSEHEAALAAQQLADPSNTFESALIRLKEVIQFANRSEQSIYQAANDAAEFERTGRPPVRESSDPDEAAAARVDALLGGRRP